MPNVLSPRDLVSGPDNMDETVLHTLREVTSFQNCLHPTKILKALLIIILEHLK